MKQMILFVTIALFAVSCKSQPCSCGDVRESTIDSLKAIYEELNSVSDPDAIVHVAEITDEPINHFDVQQPTSHYDDDQSDKAEPKPLIVNGRQALFPTSSKDYLVYCGVKNPSCDISGSLFITRVSGKTGEEYTDYLDDKQKAKLIYR